MGDPGLILFGGPAFTEPFRYFEILSDNLVNLHILECQGGRVPLAPLGGLPVNEMK